MNRTFIFNYHQNCAYLTQVRLNVKQEGPNEGTLWDASLLYFVFRQIEIDIAIKRVSMTLLVLTLNSRRCGSERTFESVLKR